MALGMNEGRGEVAGEFMFHSLLENVNSLALLQGCQPGST